MTFGEIIKREKVNRCKTVQKAVERLINGGGK